MGWGNLDNGDLLDVMGGAFDALVTVDRRLPEQQHVSGRSFGIVVVRARSNRLGDLEPLIERILEALAALEAGTVREVG